jgi:hypothetical protein
MYASIPRIAVAFLALAAMGFSELPETGPVPKPRPGPSVIDNADAGTVGPGKMTEAEIRCEAKLVDAGVVFKRLDETVSEGECGIDHPLKVTSVAGGITLSPPGLLNCAAAVALSDWVARIVAPEANRILHSDLASLRIYATYVCRTRNSVAGAKLSEHARGNAIDVGKFILADGRTIEVRQPPLTALSEKRFFGSVRKAACGPFKTVLGPGSDEHHGDHFHLDLAARRNGGLYCK